MNAVQQKLIEMKKNIPDCSSSRQRLRSILSDYFPTEKQLINSILNAYDEDVETKLRSSSDPTLTALQMIKVLQNDYGLSNASAHNAIAAWCCMLGYTEIADALGPGIESQPSTPQTWQAPSSPASIEVGLGILRAGMDIPSGELRLQVLKKTKLGINYGIGKTPNKINYDDEEFRDTTYIRIKDGEYLKLYCYETDSDYKIRITKVD